MAKLTAKERAAIPKDEFGVPSKAPGPGSFPMNDDSHAKVAKGRATQAVNAGRMSKGTDEKIVAKADKILGKKDEPKKTGKPDHKEVNGGRAPATPKKEAKELPKKPQGQFQGAIAKGNMAPMGSKNPVKAPMKANKPTKPTGQRGRR